MTNHSDRVPLCPTVSLEQWNRRGKRLYDRVPPYYYVVRARIQSFARSGDGQHSLNPRPSRHSHLVFESTSVR